MGNRFPSNSTTSTADETTIAWATFALFALIVMLRLRPTEGGTSERRAPILNAARVAEMGDADRLKPGRPARGMWVRIPPRAQGGIVYLGHVPRVHRSRQVIQRRKPEGHVWMGEDEHHRHARLPAGTLSTSVQLGA